MLERNPTSDLAHVPTPAPAMRNSASDAPPRCSLRAARCCLHPAIRITLGLLLIAQLTGCAYDPRRFRLPEVWPRHPEIERRAAEYHDPFPDDAIGPTADSRPRGFGRQRSTTRRAADLRSVHYLDGADRLPSTSHKPDRRFSQAVKP